MNTLLYFTASWCQPCKRFGPVMEAVESEFDVPVIKVDIDDDPATAQYWSIQSVPTVIKTDETLVELARIVGARPKALVQRELDL